MSYAWMILVLAVNAPDGHQSGFSRCASPSTCPSDREIEEAVKLYVDDQITEYLNQSERDNPDAMVIAPAKLIRSITNVICGETIGDARQEVICRFEVNYGDGVNFMTAAMIQDDGTWSVAKALEIYRAK